MKSYGQICGIARALDVLGDRWTMLILRDLLLGPLRYGDLLDGLEGLPTNLLAERLKHLTHAGMIERNSPDRQAAYQLTTKGRTIQPVLFALGQWGWTQCEVSKSLRRSLRWAMVSLKRRITPQFQDYVALIEPTDDGAYIIWEKGGIVGIERGKAVNAEVTLRGSSASLLKSIAEANAQPWHGAGGIKTEGQRSLWTALIRGLIP